MSSRLTRREWLRIANGAVIASGAAARLAADDAEAPKNPCLGFSLYGMKTLPVAEALRVCAEVGYECVELAVMADWPCDSEKLSREQRRDIKSRLSDRGLKLAALMENLPLAVEGDAHRRNLDRIKRAAELARDLVPNETPLIETILGGSPDKWSLLRDTFVERLHDWAKLASDCEAVLAIKAHVAGALHRPTDAAELARAVNSKHLKLAFDFSHFQLRELTMADAWAPMAEQTRFVHVKDAHGRPGEFQFLLPGEGTINYVDLFRLLRQSRYFGPVVVEVSGQIFSKPGYDPVAAAKKCWPVLKAARDAVSPAGLMNIP